MLETVGAWMQGPCHGTGTDRRTACRFCASFSGRARKYQSVFVISIPAPRTGKQGQGRSRFMGAWEGGRALSWEVRGATGSICCPTSPIDAAPAALEEFPKGKGERIQKIYAPSRLFASVFLLDLGLQRNCNCNGDCRAPSFPPPAVPSAGDALSLDSRLEQSSAAAKPTQPRARVQWLCDASKHQVRALIRPRLRIPCCAYRLPALPVVDARSPVETCRRASRKLPSLSSPPPLLLASVLLPPLRHWSPAAIESLDAVASLAWCCRRRRRRRRRPPPNEPWRPNMARRCRYLYRSHHPPPGRIATLSRHRPRPRLLLFLRPLDPAPIPAPAPLRNLSCPLPLLRMTQPWTPPSSTCSTSRLISRPSWLSSSPRSSAPTSKWSSTCCAISSASSLPMPTSIVSHSFFFTLLPTSCYLQLPVLFLALFAQP